MSRLRKLPFVARESEDIPYSHPRPERQTSTQPQIRRLVDEPAALRPGQVFYIGKNGKRTPGRLVAAASQPPDTVVFPAQITGAPLLLRHPALPRSGDYYSSRTFSDRRWQGRQVWRVEGGKFLYQNRSANRDFRDAPNYVSPGKNYRKRTADGLFTRVGNPDDWFSWTGTEEVVMNWMGDWDVVSQITYSRSGWPDQLIPYGGGFGPGASLRNYIDQTEWRYDDWSLHDGSLTVSLSAPVDFAYLAGVAGAVINDVANRDTYFDSGWATRIDYRPTEARILVTASDVQEGTQYQPPTPSRIRSEIGRFQIVLDDLIHPDSPPLLVSYDVVKRKMAPERIAFSVIADGPTVRENSMSIILEDEMIAPEDQHGSMAMEDPSWDRIGWSAGPIQGRLPEISTGASPNLACDYRTRLKWQIEFLGAEEDGPYLLTWVQRTSAGGPVITEDVEEELIFDGRCWRSAEHDLWIDTTEPNHTIALGDMRIRTESGQTVRRITNVNGSVRDSDLLNRELGADTANGETDLNKFDEQGVILKFKARETPEEHWGFVDFSQDASNIPRENPRKFFRRRRSIRIMKATPSGNPVPEVPTGYEPGHYEDVTETLEEYERGRLKPVETLRESGSLNDTEFSPNELELINAPVVSPTLRHAINTSTVNSIDIAMIHPVSRPCIDGEVVERVRHEVETVWDEDLGAAATPPIYLFADDPGHTWGIENVVIRPAEVE